MLIRCTVRLMMTEGSLSREGTYAGSDVDWKVPEQEGNMCNLNISLPRDNSCPSYRTDFLLTIRPTAITVENSRRKVTSLINNCGESTHYIQPPLHVLDVYDYKPISATLTYERQYVTNHKQRLFVQFWASAYPWGTQLWESTLMQRHDVASKMMRRCINVMCPLGIYLCNNYIYFN